MHADNPYASPEPVAEPNVALPDAPEEPRLRPLAIFVGWLTDVGSALTVGFLLGFVAAAVLFAQGRPLQELEAALTESTWLMIVDTVLSAICTVAGGYVAAWMGRTWPLRHAAAMGMLSLVTWTLLVIYIPGPYPRWLTGVSLASVLPMALLGGYLRSLRVRRRVA